MQELHDESDEARAGVAAKQETAAALHEYEAATASLARALMVDDDCGGGNKNTDQPTEVLSRSQSMSADGDILEEPGSEFRRLQGADVLFMQSTTDSSETQTCCDTCKPLSLMASPRH